VVHSVTNRDKAPRTGNDCGAKSKTVNPKNVSRVVDETMSLLALQETIQTGTLFSLVLLFLTNPRSTGRT